MDNDKHISHGTADDTYPDYPYIVEPDEEDKDHKKRALLADDAFYFCSDDEQYMSDSSSGSGQDWNYDENNADSEYSKANYRDPLQIPTSGTLLTQHE